ncbi:hypothetical protein V8E36_000060 [Tilletia maclaganii]
MHIAQRLRIGPMQQYGGSKPGGVKPATRAACSLDSDCQSNSCRSGICAGAGTNGRCATASDCASNSCGPETLQSCGSNGAGICLDYMACNAAVDNTGADCWGAGDCAGPNAFCTTLDTALKGTCTDTWPYPLGYICLDDNSCASGFCQTGVEADGVTRPPTGTCSEPFELGSPCYTSFGCARGECTNSICSLLGLGRKCDTSDQCHSGRTSAGEEDQSIMQRAKKAPAHSDKGRPFLGLSSTDLSPTSPLSSSSSLPAQINSYRHSLPHLTKVHHSSLDHDSRSWYQPHQSLAHHAPTLAVASPSLDADGLTRDTKMIQQSMHASSNNAACYNNEGCISNTCNTSAKTCTPLALNAVCTSNAQCTSSYCRQRLLADGIRELNGTCVVQKGKGSSCYQNGGCTSGSCNLSSKLCS